MCKKTLATASFPAQADPQSGPVLRDDCYFI